MPNPDGSLTPDEQRQALALEATPPAAPPSPVPLEAPAPSADPYAGVNYNPNQGPTLGTGNATPNPSPTPGNGAAAGSSDPVELIPPAPAPTGPPPVPTKTSSVEGTTTTTERIHEDPRMAGQLKQEDATQAERENLLKEQGANNTAAAQERAAAADEKAKAAADYKARMDAALKEADAQIQKDVAATRAKEEENKKLAHHDLYEGRPGAKILAAIGMALGAYGASINGGPNPGMEIVKKQMDDKFRDEEAAINKGDKELGDLNHNVLVSRQAKADKVADLNLQQSYQYEAIGDRLAAGLAKKGVDAAGIKGNLDVVESRRLAEQKRQEYLQHLQTKATTTVIRKMTEGTGGAAGGGQGGTAEERLLNQEAKEFAKQNDLQKTQQARNMIKQGLDEVEHAKSPADKKLALEKLIRGARGGTATAQALQYGLGAIGGYGAQIEGWISQAEGNGMGKTQSDNLYKALKTSVGSLDATLSEKRKAWKSYREAPINQTPSRQAALEANERAMFGQSDAPKLTDTQAAQMVKYINSAPKGDPRADSYRARLREEGRVR